MDSRDLQYLKALMNHGISQDTILKIMEDVQGGDIDQSPPSPGRRRGRPPNPPKTPLPDDGNAALEGGDAEEEPGEELNFKQLSKEERRRIYNKNYYRKNRGKMLASERASYSRYKLNKSLDGSNKSTDGSNKITDGSNKITDPLLSARFIQAPAYQQVFDPIEEVAPSKAPFLFRTCNTLTSRFTIYGKRSASEGVWIATLGSEKDSIFLSCFSVFSSFLKKVSDIGVPIEVIQSAPAREDNVKNVAIQPLFELTPYEAKGDISELALESYNRVAKACGWPVAVRLTPQRKNGLRLRLREAGGLAGWQEAMRRAGESRFLCGQTTRAEAHAGWRPDIDFFLRASSFAKLTEGVWDNREPQGQKMNGLTALRLMKEAVERRISERKAAH